MVPYTVFVGWYLLCQEASRQRGIPPASEMSGKKQAEIQRRSDQSVFHPAFNCERT